MNIEMMKRIEKQDKLQELYSAAEHYIDLLEEGTFLFGMEEKEAIELSSLLHEMMDELMLSEEESNGRY